MLLTAPLLIAAAFGATPRSGAFLPGAAPMEAGSGELLANGGGHASCFIGSCEEIGFIGLSGAIAASDDLAFTFGTGTAPEWMGTDSSSADDLAAFIAARGIGYRGESLKFALWLAGYTGFTDKNRDEDAVGERRYNTFTYGGGLGVALETGRRRAHFYLSIPVILLGEVRREPENELLDTNTSWGTLMPVYFGEAGVRLELGDHHGLSVGTLSIMPGVTWRFDREPAVIELGLHALPGLLSIANASAGWSF